MELVEGVTLTTWLRESPAWPAVVAMLAQAGRGLVAAHDRGLVHRDFKPDNVLVDRTGRARVVDFGLARTGDDEPMIDVPHDPGLARITATGELAGTPAYLAPELVAGAVPDVRSDQYAFAISLFEALHGHHPFAGSTASALWGAMANGRIRPGARAIPAWLDRCVRRGLAVDPAARWPTVAAFVVALERPRRRIWPWLASAGGAAALTMSAIALVVSRGAAPASPEPRPAAQPTRPLASAPVSPVVPSRPPAAPTSSPVAPSTPPVVPASPPVVATARSKPATPKQLLERAVEAYDQNENARSLALAEQVLATEPANDQALRLAVLNACRQRAEPSARRHAAKLTPSSRWLVWSACDREGIRLYGDIDRDGQIEHVEPIDPE